MVTLEDKLVVYRGEVDKYAVEVSTDQRKIWVVAFDREGPESYSVEMRAEEAMGRVGGYEELLAGMRVEHGELVLPVMDGGFTVR